MIFAISFLEAPLKFRAPGITTGLGLGIGKIVFKALNRVELVLAAVMLGILATYPTFAAWQAYLFAFVAIVLCLQTVWLLPALSRRADIVISGEKPPRGRLHLIFITFDILKISFLIAIGIGSISR